MELASKGQAYWAFFVVSGFPPFLLFTIWWWSLGRSLMLCVWRSAFRSLSSSFYKFQKHAIWWHSSFNSCAFPRLLLSMFQRRLFIKLTMFWRLYCRKSLVLNSRIGNRIITQTLCMQIHFQTWGNDAFPNMAKSWWEFWFPVWFRSLLTTWDAGNGSYMSWINVILSTQVFQKVPLLLQQAKPIDFVRLILSSAVAYKLLSHAGCEGQSHPMLGYLTMKTYLRTHLRNMHVVWWYLTCSFLLWLQDIEQ